MKTRLLMAVILLLGMVSTASAVTFTVGNVECAAGGTTYIPIKVDNSTGIAGAAFTLEYDKTILTVTVDSTFFNTFANQWNQVTPVPSPTPPATVNVGGTDYDQPLVENNVTGGLMLAAARCVAEATATNVRLFTLTVNVAAGAVVGTTYPIKIKASTINNPTAGYDPADTTPDTVPLLIGADPTKAVTDAAAFPVIVAADAFADNSGGGVKIISGRSIVVPATTTTGWNLVSFNLSPTNTDINTVLASVIDKIESVWAFDPATGSWKSFVPGAARNTLTTMVSGLGYWIKTKESIQIPFAGAVPPNTINVVAGWNLISFPGAAETPIATALNSITGQFISVWANDGSWRSYDPTSSRNTLTSMKPGAGYWINMKQAATISF